MMDARHNYLSMVYYSTMIYLYYADGRDLYESLLFRSLAQTRLRLQGSVRIFSEQNGKVSQSKIHNIIFKDTCCTGYRKHLVSLTSENITEVNFPLPESQ